MLKQINTGKSWGAKAFLNFGASVSDGTATQLARQTASLHMQNAILGYQANAMFVDMSLNVASMAIEPISVLARKLLSGG